MAIEVQGRVGPGYSADGSYQDLRMTKDLGLATQDLHGKYYESTVRGAVFTCSTAAAGITTASTTASPLAAGTGTPIIGLYNPQGSNKNLVINKVSVAIITTTTATGPIVWNYAINQTITATANGTINSNFLGGAAASVVKAYVNTATTGSTIGIMLRPAFLVTPIADAFIVSASDTDIAGDIIVPAGGYIALAQGSAGAATVLSAAITWEEVAI